MKALLVVDIQMDFLPGGALEVKEGDKIIPLINELLALPFDYIVATKDWHPKNHGSFASTHGKKVGEHILLEGADQILWPDHCIQGSKGSEFSESVNTEKIEDIVYKGREINIDSYSAFFDNLHRKETTLHTLLKKRGIDTLYIARLVTDYCVKYSALDALKLGYQVFVVKEACCAVNLSKGDEKRAFEEMERAGTHIINFEDVKGHL